MSLIMLLLILCLFAPPIFALKLIPPGTPCVYYENCPQIQKLSQNKRYNYGTMTLLQLLKCSQDRKKIKLYCIEPEAVLNFSEKADTLNEDICGLEPLGNKISGGEQTAVDEFPWTALLRYAQNNTLEYRCTGNLINQRYVLTAAHCLDPNKTKKYGNLHSVVLGEYDVTTEKDCDTNHDCTDGVTEVLVESVHIHPNYTTNNTRHDIALIRLKSEVTYTDFIKPICLPPPNFYAPYNETLLIAGWGLNDYDRMTNVKVRAGFQLKDHCSHPITEDQYCAEGKTAARTCNGDSGGPLMARRKNKEVLQLLIGVNSLGTRCSHYNIKISIYTRVASYIQWLVETIEK